MNNSREEGERDKTVEVETEPKTRVRECQGYGGALRHEERENEWAEIAGNCRKSEREERMGGRYEGMKRQSEEARE